jgi:hypothetical protein
MTPAVLVALGCGLTAVAAAYLALWLDYPPREPLVPLGIAVVAGGALGPAALAAAGRLQAEPLHGGAALAVLAPLGVALVALAAVRLLAGPLDGTLLGAAGGAAAGVVAVLLSARAARPPAAVDALVATLTCAGAAAVLGAGVGRARLAGRPAAVGGWLALGLAAAGATAAPWLVGRAEGTSGGAAALDAARVVVPLLALLTAPLLSARFERRVLERELGEEVANGILPGEVALVVASYPRRIRSAWWPRGDERRALVGLLRRLAFRKQQLRHLEGDRLHLAGLEVGRMRDRVRRLFDPREVEALAREFVG